MNIQGKLIVGISILAVIAVIAIIGWYIMLFARFGLFDKDYSVTELKESFEKNKSEIYELKRYFSEIVPKNRFVEIEFKDDATLGRFGITPLDSTAGDSYGPFFLEWGLMTNTSRMDSIIRPMGWTRVTLKTLKEKLDNADCIRIESGEPTKIGFKKKWHGDVFLQRL